MQSDTERMNFEIFEANLPKCINYCLRCKEIIRRIEAMLHGDPSTVNLCELFSCPPCTNVFQKFRKSTAVVTIREHDSELVHLQRLASHTYDLDDKAKRMRDDAAKAELLKARLAAENLLDTEGVPYAGAKGIIQYRGGAGTGKDLEKGEFKEPGLKKTVKNLEGKNKKKGKEAGAALSTKSLKQKNAAKSSVTSITKHDGKTKKYAKVRKSIHKGSNDMKSKCSASGSFVGLKSKKEQSSKSKTGEKFEDMTALQPLAITKKIDEYNRLKKRDLDKKRNARKTEQAEKEARRINADMPDMARQMISVSVDEVESEGGTTDECPQDVEERVIIKGNKIYKMSQSETGNRQKVVETPAVQQAAKSPVWPSSPKSDDKQSVSSSLMSKKSRDQVLRYNLSERKYVDKGWTLLPKEIVMRKVALFLMRPARKEFDWLEMNKHKGQVLYHSGEELATFDENGTRLYYRSGQLALEYYEAEESGAGDRLVVYSSGKPDNGRARPHTVLAVFDYSGNGVVYDHTGLIRLKYNQTEGVVLDRTIGPHTHWKWHNLNDSPPLHTVLIENESRIKDHRILHHGNGDDISQYRATSPDENAMRDIEVQNFIKKNKRLLKKYSPFEIKMKAFKINEHFSIRILGQSSISLTFSDGRTRVKINVGMILDPTAVVGEDFVEVGDVASGVERKPPVSESMERLQRVVRGARSAERARMLREKRLRYTPSYIFQGKQKHCAERDA